MMKSLLQFIFLLAILALCTTSCKSKQYSFDQYEGKRISIGNAGGFAGKINKFYLLENGQLFMDQGAGASAKELNRIDKNVIKQQFINYYSLGLDTLQQDDAGNLTYFIIMESDSGDKHMIKWGGNMTEASTQLLQYYNTMSALIKKHNPQNQTGKSSNSSK